MTAKGMKAGMDLSLTKNLPDAMEKALKGGRNQHIRRILDNDRKLRGKISPERVKELIEITSKDMGKDAERFSKINKPLLSWGVGGMTALTSGFVGAKLPGAAMSVSDRVHSKLKEMQKKNDKSSRTV